MIYAEGLPDVHDRDFHAPPAGGSLDLAVEIERELDALGEEIKDGGLYGKDMWYLSTVRIPAVLVELGRMTNRRDMDHLADPEVRQRTAEAISSGLIRYLRSE